MNVWLCFLNENIWCSAFRNHFENKSSFFSMQVLQNYFFDFGNLFSSLKKNIIFKSTTKSTRKFLHFFFFFFLFFLFICVQLNNKNRRFPNHLHHFVGNTHNCTQRSLSPYNPLTCSSSYHFPHFLSQTPFNLISSSFSHLPMILLIINICQSPTIIF